MIERLGLRNVLVRGQASCQDRRARGVRKKSLGRLAARRRGDRRGGARRGAGGAAHRDRALQGALGRAARAEATVYGVSPRHAELAHLALAEGRFLDALDERTHAQVCVIGAGVRRDLFGYGPALGQHAQGQRRLAGGGRRARRRRPGGGRAFEGVHGRLAASEIYLPVTTAERKFERDPLASPLDEIVVRLADGTTRRARPRAVIGELLDRLHGGADDYEMVVPEALLEQSRQTQRLFNIVMGCIAGISLLVGGIGIMNIMLATVLERTREIGVRRAVGARRGDIRFQFLVESFSISLLGGAAGRRVGPRHRPRRRRLRRLAHGGDPRVDPALDRRRHGGGPRLRHLSRHARRALDPIEALRYE